MPETTGETAVLAPVSGMLKTVARTGHAFGIKTDGGIEVLVHIGIDTVDMDGEDSPWSWLKASGSRRRATGHRGFRQSRGGRAQRCGGGDGGQRR